MINRLKKVFVITGQDFVSDLGDFFFPAANKDRQSPSPIFSYLVCLITSLVSSFFVITFRPRFTLNYSLRDSIPENNDINFMSFVTEFCAHFKSSIQTVFNQFNSQCCLYLNFAEPFRIINYPFTQCHNPMIAHSTEKSKFL